MILEKMREKNKMNKVPNSSQAFLAFLRDKIEKEYTEGLISKKLAKKQENNAEIASFSFEEATNENSDFDLILKNLINTQ